MLARAEAAAEAIPHRVARVRALAEIVRVLIATDPDRARRLADRAERTASWTLSRRDRRNSRNWLCEVLAATDPDRVERVAGRMPEAGAKAAALAKCAHAIATTDPDRARRLARQAVDTAATVPDGSYSRALVTVAGSLAVVDPGLAEGVADGITFPELRAEALARIVEWSAGGDPRRVAHVADLAEDAAAGCGEFSRALKVARIAQAIGRVDPDRAERLACEAEDLAAGMANVSQRGDVLSSVAKIVAGLDIERGSRLLDRVERLANTTTGEVQRACVLARIADGFVAVDAGRAERFVELVERIAAETAGDGLRGALIDCVRVLVLLGLSRSGAAAMAADFDRAEKLAAALNPRQNRSYALAFMAPRVAVVDPDRAERIAAAITDAGAIRAQTLGFVAVALAAADPERAERLVTGIAEDSYRVSASVRIAETWLKASEPVTPAKASADPPDRTRRRVPWLSRRSATPRAAAPDRW
ncbi:hypothetical protein [Catenulispora sp. GP43]|uniref:hypothetical protein n=1 Tax=Catenulispora sp. GP43 TaxID=3156263 RepID=UPI003519B9BF